VLKLERRARPASYLFFRYSSIALRMSALTGAPVFSERALSLLRCSSPSQMFVRFMYLLVRLSADTCQSVPKLYPIRAAGAFRAAGAPRKITKLRAFNILNGFESLSAISQEKLLISLPLNPCCLYPLLVLASQRRLYIQMY
jgi:hypothetical protein